VRLKTDAGVRDVVLLAQLAELLKEHRRKALELGHARPDGFIFSSAAP